MTDNLFRRYYDMGYRRLVPIIPPGSDISPRSTLFARVNTKQDGRGKTPGTRGRDGFWSSYDWNSHEADEADLERWHAMGAGVGVKTGAGLVAIDADTLDPDHARVIRDLVEARFGRLPVRVGNYPKALYLLRVDGPFQYRRIEFGERDARGVPDRVELLSDGKQFVAEGIHQKTGRPYEWPRPLVPFNDLPIIKVTT